MELIFVQKAKSNLNWEHEMPPGKLAFAVIVADTVRPNQPVCVGAFKRNDQPDVMAAVKNAT